MEDRIPRKITDPILLAGLDQPGAAGRSGRSKSVDQGNGIKNLIVPMDKEFHSAFKRYCVNRDMDMASAVRAYIKTVLGRAEEFEEEQLERKKREWEEKWKNTPGAQETLDRVSALSIEDQLALAAKEGIE